MYTIIVLAISLATILPASAAPPHNLLRDVQNSDLTAAFNASVANGAGSGSAAAQVDNTTSKRGLIHERAPAGNTPKKTQKKSATKKKTDNTNRVSKPAQKKTGQSKAVTPATSLTKTAGTHCYDHSKRKQKRGDVYVFAAGDVDDVAEPSAPEVARAGDKLIVGGVWGCTAVIFQKGARDKKVGSHILPGREDSEVAAGVALATTNDCIKKVTVKAPDRAQGRVVADKIKALLPDAEVLNKPFDGKHPCWEFSVGKNTLTIKSTKVSPPGSGDSE